MTHGALIERARQALGYGRGHGRQRQPRVEIITGDSAPKITGDTWHYERSDGSWVMSRYRGAHFTPKWRRSVRYVASTEHIAVGAGWRP